MFTVPGSRFFVPCSLFPITPHVPSNSPLSCPSYDYPPNSCRPEKNPLPSASVRLCVLCASSLVQVCLRGLQLFVPRVVVAAPPSYRHLCSFVFICGQFTSSVVGRPGGASRFACGHAAPCFSPLIYVVVFWGGGGSAVNSYQFPCAQSSLLASLQCARSLTR